LRGRRCSCWPKHNYLLVIHAQNNAWAREVRGVSFPQTALTGSVVAALRHTRRNFLLPIGSCRWVGTTRRTFRHLWTRPQASLPQVRAALWPGPTNCHRKVPRRRTFAKNRRERMGSNKNPTTCGGWQQMAKNTAEPFHVRYYAVNHNDFLGPSRVALPPFE